MTDKVFIGTSNVVLPGPKHTFPVEFQSLSRLGYYSTLFNSVEINSTFYKLPQRKTLIRWVAETRQEFKFSLKLPRTITHNKQLIFEPSDIEIFVELANAVIDKRGCLLVQFPASITQDYFDSVKSILKEIRQTNQAGWHVFVEFRHESWYVEHVFKMLAAQQANLVLHDKGDFGMPTLSHPFDVVYLRFHGPKGDYRGTYSHDALEHHAEQIRQWLTRGKTIFAYFNNSIGTAFADATRLRMMCSDYGP